MQNIRKNQEKTVKTAHFVCKSGTSRAQVGCKSPRRADAKRGDLRAYLGSVEGLYPLEGLMRFTGISEGFTGKE